MFTGIIERAVRVIGVADGPSFRRLTIPKVWDDVGHGESVAVNGACLTIAEIAGQNLHFDVITETLEKTNLGSLRPGDEVHVERAMRIGDRFDGHFVQGHIDGTAIIVSQRSLPGEWRTRLRLPTPLAKYLVPKGSIAIDGISLTLAAIDGSEFEVALIPTTTTITRLAQKPEGTRCNVECDMLTKTVVAVLEQRGAVATA